MKNQDLSRYGLPGQIISELLLDSAPGRVLSAAVARVVTELVVCLGTGQWPVRFGAGRDAAETAVIIRNDRIHARIEAGCHAADGEEPYRVVLAAHKTGTDTGRAVRVSDQGGRYEGCGRNAGREMPRRAGHLVFRPECSFGAGIEKDIYGEWLIGGRGPELGGCLSFIGPEAEMLPLRRYGKSKYQHRSDQESVHNRPPHV